MSALDDAFLARDITTASFLTAGRTPASVFEEIDYQAMFDDAEPHMEFYRAYYDAAGVLERVDIADWILRHSTTALAYLDIEAEVAHLLTRAVSESIHYLADKLNNTVEADDGPDAGLTRAQAEHYQSIAETLRGIEVLIAAKTRSDETDG